MSVQVENLEKNMAKLTIEVPAEELEKALEKAYQKQKKNISVPGNKVYVYTYGRKNVWPGSIL